MSNELTIQEKQRLFMAFADELISQIDAILFVKPDWQNVNYSPEFGDLFISFELYFPKSYYITIDPLSSMGSYNIPSHVIKVTISLSDLRSTAIDVVRIGFATTNAVDIAATYFRFCKAERKLMKPDPKNGGFRIEMGGV